MSDISTHDHKHFWFKKYLNIPTNPYYLVIFRRYCTHYQGTVFKSFIFYFYWYCNIHKTMTKQSNAIIKQYFCRKKRLLKRNNLAELMLLFKAGLSCLISKLSSISSTNLFFPFAKTVYFLKDRILLQFRKMVANETWKIRKKILEKIMKSWRLSKNIKLMRSEVDQEFYMDFVNYINPLLMFAHHLDLYFLQLELLVTNLQTF